ncbi:MAG: hypothetical protein A2W92_18935 [Bacteroidetes bacterium GWA2_42_15]|nr:MAG: hypothetical protein A2W92_18935 [Bacteroidetes bacterium GWA2_42_15]
MNRFLTFFILMFIGISLLPATNFAQKFIHPGVYQTRGDLDYMKKQVLQGEQPWKDAFVRLKEATNLDFEVKPFAHVLRGPYGKPNIGGDDLSKGSVQSYNCALLWYITGEKMYAEKAIEILNAWSPVLWDFDYNDAKLLAGWTGHQLCNAAEILRYTDSGWKQKDIDRFTEMLMTVYYPLMRFYYPQANGNWDGAIIQSILAIAVFTDNREIFDNGVDHFLHGPVNGSIFKYIYPSGQCQESMRDQGHVQLGLGEFAGAARIAYTQGIDLFSIADNRIALGYEYTAQFLMDKTPHCYGPISERAKNLRDDYEYVYRHYSAQGLEMPYTKMAADSVRPAANRSILTAFRVPSEKAIKKLSAPVPGKIAYPAGAMEQAVAKVPTVAVHVSSGESIQEALDAAAKNRGWVVATAGVHTLPTTLKIPSGVTLSGEGLETVLLLDPSLGVRDAEVNAEPDMHDVTICDLVIEGGTKIDRGSDPNSSRSYRSSANRGAIMFLGQSEGQMKNINLLNLTVRNCTYNGVFISGAEKVKVDCCNFDENGSGVVPGSKLQHNLLLTHCSEVSVTNSRMDTSPHGSGIALTKCKNANISACEIARNAYYGLLITESSEIVVSGNLIEGNDRSGVMVEFLYNSSENVGVSNNLIHYNNGFGLESYAAHNLKSANNIYAGNGKLKEQERVSEEKFIIMQ